MSLLYENFLRTTHSEDIQEWYDDLKRLLENLEGMPDPEPEDVQLAFHLNQIIENFELMESNLLDRRRSKNQNSDDRFDYRSKGTSVLFD
jgi:hypothetical protein